VHGALPIVLTNRVAQGLANSLHRSSKGRAPENGPTDARAKLSCYAFALNPKAGEVWLIPKKQPLSANWDCVLHKVILNKGASLYRDDRSGCEGGLGLRR